MKEAGRLTQLNPTATNIGNCLALIACLSCLSACNVKPDVVHPAAQSQPVAAASVDMVRCETIQERRLSENITTTGQVTPDVGKESDVAPRFSGRILQVKVKPGDFVVPGQELAIVDSHEVASLQAELIEAQAKLEIAKAHEQREKQVYEENLLRPQSLLQARTEFDRSKVALDLELSEYERIAGLRAEKIAAEKDFLTAKANLAHARLAHTAAGQQLEREENLYRNKALLRKELQLAEAESARAKKHVNTLIQRLQFVGMNKELIDEVMKTGQIQEHFPMRARLAGVITHQDAAVGELIEPSRRIFTITDLSTVVVSIDIPEVDVKWIKIGSPAKIKIASYPDQVFNGSVSYISDTVNTETRTVPVKVKLNNPSLKLKTNMFAEIELEGTARSALACPKDAIQQREGHTIVFVKEGNDYRARKVELGKGTERFSEVISGLSNGDQVVTQGSLLLKTELTLTQ